MKQNDHIYYVILAGGSGERLWPLSRSHQPKQFLQLSNQITLLEETILRIRPLSYDKNSIWVSTTAQYATQIQNTVGHLIGRIVIEPAARNTGPAILYNCYELMAVDEDARVIFLPADAFIAPSDYEQFRSALQTAIEHVRHEYVSIVVLGVKPSFAATGYGYIEYNTTKDMVQGCHKVRQFYEKPTTELASYYSNRMDMLWNVGIVVTSAKKCIALFKRYETTLFEGMQKLLSKNIAYQELPAISFDYAVLEKSDAVWVVPTSIVWSDVGNLNVFLHLLSRDQPKKALVALGAHNNLVHVKNKLVVLLGIDDICIVDTHDVLFIAHRSELESTKTVIAHLKQSGLSEYL